MVGLMAFTSAADQARAERNFDPRFSQNVQGDITIAANTIMTCPETDSRCPAARAGTGSALNNNQFRMVYVDQDGDPATFNSSTAELVLPDGATVLFAGLYYGAKTSAGTGGSQAPNTAARGTVKFKVPGGTAYQTLTAAVDDSTEVARAYGAFVDVTSIVQSAGVGSYTVADVQAGTGEDRYGGWSLVVAYRDSAEPARNLTIFDGLNNVTKAKPAITIGVTGFQTPATGPVKTNLGFVSFEGDRGLGGDNATLNGKVLSTATNPANNFFNSSISKDGVPVTTKQPDYNNQLGYDAVLMKADDFLANGASSAAIRLQTTNETYLPQVISFATELFSPDIEATKTVENLTNPGGATRSGDTLRYTVTYTNTGGDGATQFVAEDVIPANTTYVPGSLEVTAGPNAPFSPTDAIGDDIGEFIPNANLVRFRLGQGASATRGGLLTAAGGAANSATVSFEVEIDSGLPSGTAITNRATALFQSQTLNTSLREDSAPVVSTVQAPDLRMGKRVESEAGLNVTFSLGVTNVGGLVTDGTQVTVTDTFPPSAFASITDPGTFEGWSCSTSGPSNLTLTCTRSNPLPASDEYPNIPVTATLVDPPPPGVFSNTAVVSGGGDTNTRNNEATAFLPVTSPTADLELTKTASPTTVGADGRITFTLIATNNGPFNATGVSVTDNLPAGLTGVTARPSQGTCPTVSTTTVTCAIGGLASGSTATIQVTALVGLNNQPSVTNEAEVTAFQDDPYPENNKAEASFKVANSANLSVTKSGGPNPVAGNPIAGDPYTYTLTVENKGPSPASNVVVNDEVPELFTPSSVSAPGFDCGTLPGPGGELSCALDNQLALANGATAEIKLNGTLSSASAGVPVINSAVASSAEGKSDPFDAKSSTTIVPVPFADVSVSKFASKSKVQPGEAFTYTLGVNNRGPVVADPVKVVDTLGNGLEVLTKPSSCRQKGRELTCNLGKLGVSKTRKLTIRVRARSGLTGKIASNSVRVTAPQPDPVQASNSDEWRTPVGRQKVKARVTQKVPSKPIRSGKKGRVRIVVKNPSKKAITNAEVCQKLPRQLVPVKPKRRGLASKSRGEICWKVGTLAPKKKKEYWVNVRAISSKPTRVRTEATLSGGNAASQTDRGRVRIRPGPPPKPRPITG